jgi:hypothetical protein
MVLTIQHPLLAKVDTNFTDKQQLLGRCSSLADYKPFCFVYRHTEYEKKLEQLVFVTVVFW